MTTQLNPETEKYIADKISSGLYASSRDVIEAGIHLLRKKKILPYPHRRKPFRGAAQPQTKEVEAKIKAGERLLRENR